MNDLAATTQDRERLSSGPAKRNDSLSVRRTLQITDVIADRAGPTGLSLGELAKALSMNKSTVHRLLQPLLDAHLVLRLTTGTYRLGVKALTLGQAYLRTLDFRDAARPELRELAVTTGECVHLVIYDRPDVVYVDKVDSSKAVRMYSYIGARMPAYCTAVGKILLANASEDEVEAVLTAGLPRRTEHTITTEQDLRAELAHAATAGYAIDNRENEPEICCVAAPIADTTGRTVSAISVSGPAQRMPLKTAHDLAPRVITTASRISAHLGAN